MDTKVLIVLNTAPVERNFRVLNKNDAFEAVLPRGSVATYVYQQ